MLFNSYAFLFVFLPLAMMIYALADRSDTWRSWVLVALSLVFYAYWDVRFLPLMIGSIVVNWYAASFYRRVGQGTIVTVAILVNLAVLAIFKYTDFVAESVASLFGWSPVRFDFVLPLGISFFTFHHIMYLVDLRRGTAPLYPLDRYALYICFFPQAIAGPIARWHEVMDQFGRRVFAPGWEHRCAAGATFVVLGLVQKTMLADPIGRAVDPIYARAMVGAVSDGSAWMAFAFAFQVFFDFAGYSDIAIGLALMFGIVLPRNFDAPFRATSLVEFWQRWHMTLARFLRDYVYTPLSRLRIGGPRRRWSRALVAIVLTMALCGLWHGAGWHFVVWGVSQGAGIVIASVWSRYFPSLPAWLGWAATSGYFVFTIVFFRAGSLEAAWRLIEGLASWPAAVNGWRSLAIAAFCAVVLPPSHLICARLTERPRPLVATALSLALVAALVFVGGQDKHEFIYFQF